MEFSFKDGVRHVMYRVSVMSTVSPALLSCAPLHPRCCVQLLHSSVVEAGEVGHGLRKNRPDFGADQVFTGQRIVDIILPFPPYADSRADISSSMSTSLSAELKRDVASCAVSRSESARPSWWSDCTGSYRELGLGPDTQFIRDKPEN